MIEPFLPIGEYGPYPERLRDQFGTTWQSLGEKVSLRSDVVLFRVLVGDPGDGEVLPGKADGGIDGSRRDGGAAWVFTAQEFTEGGLRGCCGQSGGREGAHGGRQFSVVDHKESGFEQIGGEFLLAGFVGAQGREVLSLPSVREA